MDTIVAAATPLMNGGVSIVRISGDKSIFFAEQICSQKNGLNFLNVPRTMQLVNVNVENIKDKALAVFFKAPNSFTGEDIVEFQLHGGVLITTKIIDALIKLGARQASAGEFSKRAFLNGKISLEQAEGVVDLINAESAAELKAASALTSGNFFKLIRDCQQKLLMSLAELDVLIDYESETDAEKISLAKISTIIGDVKGELIKILNTHKTGKLIKNGASIAIVGNVNAGKSSLLNAIVDEDVAIVSNIAGTTRDIVKETILVDGIKLNFLDTAGLRETDNEIEKIGIDKARKTINESDVILYIIDSSELIQDSDLEFIKKLDKNKMIVVLNKIDLVKNLSFDKLKDFNLIKVSAAKKQNIKELINKITSLVQTENLDSTQFVLTNERHAKLVSDSINFLSECLNNIDESIDIIASILQSAYNSLGEITGEVGADAIVDKIFSSFCVGK